MDSLDMACAKNSSVLESTPPLSSKFRGCLIGALVGDCLGSKYEFCSPLPSSLHGYMTKLLNGERKKELKYTDDSAMTLCIAKSLVEKGKVDPEDLAKRFVKEYFYNPNRCYGGNVVTVFKVLRDTKFEDVFKPAQKQFNGSGSFGNGAAMRISPVALFASYKDLHYLKIATEQSAWVTHTHPLGIHGAILQAFAINDALKLNPEDKFDPIEFINQLITKMKEVEGKDLTYCESLEKMKIYVKKDDVDGRYIADHLGNKEHAHESVQSAIFSFLRGMHALPDFECSNPFMRTMYFAISIGGDTDTIASMAGAIAGAYYGIKIIPQVVKDNCELISEFSKVAPKLYARCYPS